MRLRKKIDSSRPEEVNEKSEPEIYQKLLNTKHPNFMTSTRNKPKMSVTVHNCSQRQHTNDSATENRLQKIEPE